MHCASLTDLNESFALGQQAVKEAEKQNTAVMLTLIRESDHPYKVSISTTPVTNVANAAKSVPQNMINEEGNDVTAEMIDYLQPLIEGQPDIHYQNGLPAYLPISHLFNNN